MASHTYTYDIALETANGVWNRARLQDEIINDGGIAGVLQALSETSGAIEIVFAAELPDNEHERLTEIVAAHSGAPVGGPVLHGVRFESTLGSATDVDISFDHDRSVQGATIEVVGFTDGDYINMVIVHPTAGVVGTLCEHVYIPPSGCLEVISEGAAKILAGSVFRLIYHSIAMSGDLPLVYAAYRMWA